MFASDPEEEEIMAAASGDSDREEEEILLSPGPSKRKAATRLPPAKRPRHAVVSRMDDPLTASSKDSDREEEETLPSPGPAKQKLPPAKQRRRAPVLPVNSSGMYYSSVAEPCHFDVVPVPAKVLTSHFPSYGSGLGSGSGSCSGSGSGSLYNLRKIKSTCKTFSLRCLLKR